MRILAAGTKDAKTLLQHILSRLPGDVFDHMLVENEVERLIWDGERACSVQPKDPASSRQQIGTEPALERPVSRLRGGGIALRGRGNSGERLCASHRCSGDTQLAKIADQPCQEI